MIIGITGTLGAGKGTIVEYLVEKEGFSHYSVRSYLIKEIEKQGMPVNRDSMASVANELRATHGPSCITEALFKEAEAAGGDCIIESIRAPGEVEALQKQPGFFLFAVDCDIKTRYQRIRSRKSETDHISFETFVDNEQREMHSTDPNKQNLSRCISMADFVFTNENNIESLHQQVKETLDEIRKNH